MAKTVLAANGLDVPDGEVVTSASDVPSILPPSVVKPVENGSSVGGTVVDDAAGYPAALAEALRYDRPVLLEERIGGRQPTLRGLRAAPTPAPPGNEGVPKRAVLH